jgi:hypothetical protein
MLIPPLSDEFSMKLFDRTVGSNIEKQKIELLSPDVKMTIKQKRLNSDKWRKHELWKLMAGNP